MALARLQSLTDGGLVLQRKVLEIEGLARADADPGDPGAVLAP